MKKYILAVLVMTAFPLSALAGTYSNDFLTLTYPAGWTLHEVKIPSTGQIVGQTASRSAASRFGGINITDTEGFLSGGAIADQAVDAAIGTAQDTAVSGVAAGTMAGMRKNMPKFASASLRRQNPYGEIMITIVEGSGGADMGAGQGSGGSGGSGESKCKIIENNKTVSWGGRKATSMTMACPSGDEWQWTSFVTMSKSGAHYTLLANMPSKSSSPDEFNANMKGAVDTILRTTQFK